ncbi:MAG: N-acetylmuramoyl-L-alanine amidase [Rhizobiaceae bacterium]
MRSNGYRALTINDHNDAQKLWDVVTQMGPGQNSKAMLKTFVIPAVTMLAVCFGVVSTTVQAATEGTVPDKAAVAYAARLVGDAKRARLIVDFDSSVSYKISVIKDPKRVVINLSKTVFSLNKDATDLPDSVVETFRFGAIDPQTSRIVLSLSAPALVDSKKLKSLNDRGRHRLIVDLVSVDADKFERTALENAETLAVAKPAKPKPEQVERKRRFLVVLDPGHGGIDYGAGGRRGVQEKDVTLNFAKQLAAQLQKNSSYQVMMTRDDDSFVSLTERLEFARRVRADLFVSIHADSLRQRNIRGATVYTLSKKGSDSLARDLARKQNRSDLIAGFALPKLEAPVNDILIDLTRRETKSFSKRFAQSLVGSMRKGVRLIRNPLRSADFFVLKAPEVPSVLLELGYLSNGRDEKLLASKKWQHMVAGRMRLAVDKFFAPRLAAKP